MASRPTADKDKKPAATKPAAKKAAPRSRSQAPKEPLEDVASPPRDGNKVLKDGVSRFFSRGRELLSEKGPGLLSSIERATNTAIDQTAKGISAFERAANEAEVKVGQGLKDMLDRRRTSDNSDNKPKGPKA